MAVSEFWFWFYHIDPPNNHQPQPQSSPTKWASPVMFVFTFSTLSKSTRHPTWSCIDQQPDFEILWVYTNHHKPLLIPPRHPNFNQNCTIFPQFLLFRSPHGPLVLQVPSEKVFKPQQTIPNTVSVSVFGAVGVLKKKKQDETHEPKCSHV